MVGFGGRELEFGNESVDLVDDEDGAEMGEVGLAKHGDGLHGTASAHVGKQSGER